MVGNLVTPVHHERTKLAANSLDSLSTAFGIVWLVYDSRRSKHKQHPGE